MKNIKSYDDLKNIDYSEFAKWLYSLPPLEFAALACLLGLLISAPLTINEQNSIGNFFELVGQVLLTANAQGQTLNSSNPVTQSQLNELKREIEKLKQKK